MSRRRSTPEHVELEPGSTIRVVCTGKGTHAEVRFGATSKTAEGREWTEYATTRAEVRDRREIASQLESTPGIKRSSALNRVTHRKTIRFECPACGLNYQRHAETWRHIVDTFRDNAIKVLDLSKLPL